MNNYVITLMILINLNVYSQSPCAFSTYNNLNYCLNFSSSIHTSEAMNSVVDRIISPLGLMKKNFIIKSCDKIANAVAVHYKGNRYILMDENYISSLSQNKKVSYYLVLAHEIAHHLNGHTVLGVSPIKEQMHQQELDCDYFAGYSLSNLGFTLDQCIKEARNLLYDPNYNINSTHPPLSKRLKAIEDGYMDAERKLNTTIITLSKIIDQEYQKAMTEHYSNKLTYMYEDARESYISVIKNNSIDNLDEVINKYLKMDYISDDITFIKSDLGTLYLRKGHFSTAYTYFISAYNISSNPNYLLNALQVAYEGNLPIDSSAFEPLFNIDYKSLNHPNSFKYLAIFTSSYNISNAIKIIKYALDNWGKFNLQEWELFLNPNLYCDYSVLLLRDEQYITAYEAILTAYELYQIEKKLLTQMNKHDQYDFSTVLSNKAILELKLEKWNECIKTCDLLLSYFSNSTYVLSGTVDSYMAISLFNNGAYENSIIYLSEAINKINDNGLLYYYRGLAHAKLKNSQKSITDFTIACDKKIEKACPLIKNVK